MLKVRMIMRNEHFVRALVVIGATVAFNAGCAAHAQVYAEAEAPVVFVEPPTLVAIEPDVWVVSDYDYAVYYVGGFYWVQRDNVWRRARSYDSGWAVVEVSIVPTVIVHRHHDAYIRYRGAANAQTRRAPREHARSEPERRPPDHAAAQHGGPPGYQDSPGLGNERRVQDGEHGGPLDHHDTPGQGTRNDKRDDKNDKNDKNDKKHDKQGKPKRK
jgi:hypothetical protein